LSTLGRAQFHISNVAIADSGGMGSCMAAPYISELTLPIEAEFASLDEDVGLTPPTRSWQA
jgi:hypothetical protein